MKRNFVFLPLIACLLLLIATPVRAQLSQGAISGNILDSSGAAIKDAAIVATGQETGTVYKTVSSSGGTYVFPNMSIGSYRVVATAKGFKTTEVNDVQIAVGTVTPLHLTMQVGEVSETVTVQADALTVQTESSEIAGVITAKQDLDLPLNLNGSVVSAMRSPEAFVFLLPGTAGPGTANGQGGTWESKISGGQNYSTEVLLDGASMYRSENGSSFDETAPSIEAISEFKVSLSTPPAETGRTTGGVESFSTKAGTNDYHGTVYDMYKNRALDANNWGNNYYLSVYKDDPLQAATYKRSADEKNDYGLALGGPVRIPHLYNGKDKTFFFFSWEQYRQTVGGTSTSTVPTVAERGGDMSDQMTSTVEEASNPCTGQPVYYGQVFDPSTTRTVSYTDATGKKVTTTCRSAFANNNIATAMNAVNASTQSIINNIMSYYPMPTVPNSITNNFVYAWSYPIIDTTYSFRIDQNITDKQRAYFTYNTRDNERLSGNPWFPSEAGAGTNQSFVTHYFRFGYDYTITPTILNHLTLGYNRTNSGNYATGVLSGKDWDSQLGIGGASGRNFPDIYAWGDTAMGGTVDGDSIDNGYRLNDTVTWAKGRHTIKLGLDYRLQLFNPITHSAESGTIGFNPFVTAADVNTAYYQNGVPALLLGLPGYGTLEDYSSQPKWISHYYAFFAQDSWKASQSLVLNYGFRYDVDVPRHEAHGNTSNLDLTATNSAANGILGALAFAGQGTGRSGKTDEQWADTWHKNFGPRVGFVWAPSSMRNTFSLAGGYGVLYGPLQYADYGASMQAGFTAVPTFNSPDGLTQAFDLSGGFPSYTKAPNFDPTQANFGAYPSNAYIARGYGRPGMIQSYSLEVQQQLMPDLLFDLAYVGSRGTHLRSTFDATNSISIDKFALGNTLNETVANAGYALPFASFPSGYTVGQSLRPYPQFYAINTDCCLENRGTSSYNALEAQLQRRMRNGISLQVSYTWSKTLTNADSAVPYFSYNNGGGGNQNLFEGNKHGDNYAISNQDLTNMLVLSYIYELPFGKGKKFFSHNRLVDSVISGWQIGGVQRYQSGQPISFYGATGIPGYDGMIHFNRVPGQKLLSKWARNGHFNPALQSANTATDNYNANTNPDPYRFFNYAALTDPNAVDTVANRGSYTFGNMAKTTDEIRTWMYKDEDFSLIKRTRITNTLAFRFEADVIDVFNRHIFNRPQSDGPTDLSNFGYVSPTSMVVGPRNIQILAKFEF